MKITPITTHKVLPYKESLFQILDRYITSFNDRSILAVTSKIVAICEGRIVKIGTVSKQTLIEQEADYYLTRDLSKYGYVLTITKNVLARSAGIDESNANGYYVLWPKDPQRTANKVREYLSARFSISKVGVIIIDSRTIPLKWGTIGTAIAHSGFLALRNYIGKGDIFGRKLKVTEANTIEGLAAGCVLVMGEGKEQTPLAVVEDLSFIEFQKRNPNQKELQKLRIKIDDDFYAPLLKSVKWKQGKK